MRSGIVLDFRGNSGGSFGSEALMGRFVPAGRTLAFDKKYESAGKVQYGGPVVAIVDATVRSAGETGSGMFEEDGRGVEGIGVAPHELVSYAVKGLEAGVDTLLARALAILARFPDDPACAKERVPHDPKDFGWK